MRGSQKRRERGRDREGEEGGQPRETVILTLGERGLTIVSNQCGARGVYKQWEAALFQNCEWSSRNCHERACKGGGMFNKSMNYFLNLSIA